MNENKINHKAKREFEQRKINNILSSILFKLNFQRICKKKNNNLIIFVLSFLFY
jgi:hypothetical protein